MKMLVKDDFQAKKMGDTIHGWSYEDERYRVILSLCWDGCDIEVTFKKSPANACRADHVKKGEPSFDDADVKTALAIANILVQEAESSLH